VGLVAGVFLVIVRAFVSSYMRVGENAARIRQIKATGLRQIGLKL
jgi:hypothetical protein